MYKNLFSSRNRTEISLGKKLKDYLPETEKIQKVSHYTSQGSKIICYRVDILAILKL
jgi:hypothetical protein